MAGRYRRSRPELVKGVSEEFGGITTDAFEQEVAAFFATARHPTLGVPYTQLAYRPMRELLSYLQANGKGSPRV